MPTTLAYPEAPPERGRGARVDGELKVIGHMMYADDLALPGYSTSRWYEAPRPTRVSSPPISRRPGKFRECTVC